MIFAIGVMLFFLLLVTVPLWGDWLEFRYSVRWEPYRRHPRELATLPEPVFQYLLRTAKGNRYACSRIASAEHIRGLDAQWEGYLE